MVSLTKRQGTLCYALESAIYKSTPTDDLIADLTDLCVDLETTLRQEDERLTEQGTDPNLDDRWILNLHRLEHMQTVLNLARSIILARSRSQKVAGVAA